MPRYSATFADGTTITRKSERGYAVAWRATWTNADGSQRAETGFAKTREQASPFRPAPRSVWPGMPSSQRSAAKRENEKFIAASGYRVEFAPAIAQ